MVNTKPVLLDLFCGGGGAAFGYMQAGFDVIGIDIAPHKNYPGTFIQADVFQYDVSALSFDVVHLSPPCQNYSLATKKYRLAGKIYPDLVEPSRRLAISLGKPYVIENVPSAPLTHQITLCGLSFGLNVYRHRKFESNILLFQPEHFPHKNVPDRARMLTIVGNSYNKRSEGKLAMGITHKINRKELDESIPPAYTKYIGLQLLHTLNSGSNL